MSFRIARKRTGNARVTRLHQANGRCLTFRLDAVLAANLKELGYGE